MRNITRFTILTAIFALSLGAQPFIEAVKATFVAQGQEMAAKINSNAEKEYLQAIQNWVAYRVQKPGLTAPTAPFAVEASFSFDGYFSLTIKPTTRPVSNIEASSFLSRHGTDVNPVGGPVGGPIPGTVNKFYCSSTDDTPTGTLFTAANGALYVKVSTTPFTRFWVNLGK